MKSDVYQKTIDACQRFISHIDEQNDKIIIILDNDKEWLEVVKTKTKHDQNIIPISDTEEFRSFVHVNGCSKMYIDMNIGAENGIDLAEEMALKDSFGELFFVSNEDPPEHDLERIQKLGAKFVLKENVLKTIIYPEKG